jgi:acetate kinase
MNILIINAGSSSLKFQVYEMPSEKMRCAGIAERIGEQASSLHYHVGGNEKKEIETGDGIKDHAAALQAVIAVLQDDHSIDLIAHRVVHGGAEFTKATLINKEVKESIRQLSSLAPLHNPVNLRCIELAEKSFPGIKQVAVFDTAFHHAMPEVASRYAIPDKYVETHQVKAYGFHGINHKYVTGLAAAYLQKNDARMISLHLGNGCSAAAVRGGQSLDTSMGFGPVNGLVMATRAGDLDPSVLTYLLRELKTDPAELDEMLNKESGLKALCGMTDMRDIHQAIKNGDRRAAFAGELYAYRIRKYIGAYVAVLNGADALIFTGGVGEHAAFMRELVCKELEAIGIQMDKKLNQKQGEELREINIQNSKVKILVIPANEELEIARQAYAL